MNVVVLDPGTIVAPLLVRFPANATEFPAVKVPEVSVMLPEAVKDEGAVKFPAVWVTLPTTSAVVEPPTVRVPPDLLIARVLNVCVPSVPFIDWAPDPLKVTVPAPGVNVPPLLVKSPATLVFVPAASVVPEFKRMLPDAERLVGPVKVPVEIVRSSTFRVVVLPPTLTDPLELLIVMSLKV